MAFKIDVEIPLFLTFFAMYLSATSTSDYTIYTSCYVTLGYNESVCALLGTRQTNNETAKLEAEVQPYATRITVTAAVIDAIFAPLMCFFLGSWSDRFGRKPVMLVALAGFTSSQLLKTIISLFQNASPWFILISALPPSVTGGIPALMTSMLCLVTDTTTTEERGIKLYIVEGMVGLAIIISSLICSMILKASGYVGVFSISFLCGVIAWLFTFFWIKESVRNVETTNSLQSLFNFKLLVTTIKTVLKPRDHYVRSILLVTFVILGLNVFITFGTFGVIFLYLRNKFSWALEQCNFYSSVMTMITIVGGTLAVALFYKVLRFKETSMVLLSLLACSMSSMLQGFAQKKYEVYIAGSLNFLSSIISPMCRSLLSKLVEAEDTGKIFSILVTVEALFNLSGTLFYTFIYNHTLTTQPSSFYFVTAGVHIISVILIGVVRYLQRYSNQLVFEELPGESIT